MTELPRLNNTMMMIIIIIEITVILNTCGVLSRNLDNEEVLPHWGAIVPETTSSIIMLLIFCFMGFHAGK